MSEPSEAPPDIAKEIERRISSWFNYHSVDNLLNKPDWLLAIDVMNHQSGNPTLNFSISQLIQIEKWGERPRVVQVEYANGKVVIGLGNAETQLDVIQAEELAEQLINCAGAVRAEPESGDDDEIETRDQHH